ncbi:MAG: hypothetical protein A2Z40_04110 [Deltaproteobacteria bacterium RBG_19FT_COMBO_60_16]|nr:MAG: hypothetical protein A2Z40_04110 [Deltaproteobacteria bacterium RBG_19FT_COMBO_60_16]
MGCDLERFPRQCAITQQQHPRPECKDCKAGEKSLAVMERPQPGELPVSAPEMRKNRKSGVYPFCIYRAPQDRDLCILAQQNQHCPKEIECDRKRGGVRGRPKSPGPSARSPKRRPMSPIFLRGLSGIGVFPAFGRFR